jgi:hypothetical protein
LLDSLKRRYSTGNTMPMKTIRPLAAWLIVTFAATAAIDARTIKLPNDEFAIASVDFPSSWNLKSIHNGIEGTSPDGAVYISAVAIGNQGGLMTDLQETQQILDKHHVTLDKSTQRENRFTVNGLDALEYVYRGRDEDGPTAVSVCKFTLGDKMIVMTYWVSTKDEQRHASEVRRIVLSLTSTSGSEGVRQGRKTR